jgi:imidazolonepropionase-like amidohydrolase
MSIESARDLDGMYATSLRKITWRGTTRRFSPITLLIVSLSVAFPEGQQRPPAAPLLVKAARLLDVRAGAYRLVQAILVVNDRISRIGPISQVGRGLPVGTLTVDLGSATLLPGLIDAHAHVLASMDGGIDFAPKLLRAINLSVPERVVVGKANARELLNAGFTTIRTSDLRVDGDITLRDAISAGSTPGPRILASGRKITPPGGQSLSSRTVDDATLRREYLPVANSNEATLATRELLRERVDVVKIVADDDKQVLTTDVIAAVVRTAHAASVRVAAHATTAAGIQSAIDGGVDSVEHGTQATDSMLMAMRDKHIAFDPTPLAAQAFRAIFIGDRMVTDPERPSEQLVAGYVDYVDRLIRRAEQLNVTIVTGSDMWWTYPGKTRGQATATVFQAFVHAGMSPAAVIRASTISAAAVLGWSDRVGSLEPGHYADIIAVTGDPLRDVGALGDVMFVMKGGMVVVRPK